MHERIDHLAQIVAYSVTRLLGGRKMAAGKRNQSPQIASNCLDYPCGATGTVKGISWQQQQPANREA